LKLNDNRIRFLYQSWRSGSMRAASEVLDVAPSSISRQIAQLESEIGIRLIEHGRREIHLTDAGRLLLDYYQDQLASQESLRSRLLDLVGMRTGHVQLALGEGFLGEALYSTIDEFQDSHPGFTLSVRVTDTTEMLRLLAEDEVHFGLAFHPPAEQQILSRFRATVPLRAIVHPDHPLAGKSKIGLAELCAHPLALMDQRFRIRQTVDLAASDCGQNISPVLTTNSIAMLIRTARAKRAATVLPEFSVRTELDTGRLVAVEIDSIYFQSLYVHLITRQRRQLSPVVLSLMQKVRERLGPVAKYSGSAEHAPANPLNLPSYSGIKP